MRLLIKNLTLISTAAIVGLTVSIVAQVFALTAKYIYDLSIGNDISAYFTIFIELKLIHYHSFHVY